MATFDLGIFYEPHPDELAEMSDAIVDLTGDEPQKEQVVGFAGPNDVVQILIDAENWQKVLLAIGTVFGWFVLHFSQELGKLAAADVWKDKSKYYEVLRKTSAAPFHRLMRAIQALRAKHQTVSVAVKVPGTPRNAGLVLASDDPAEVAWQICNVVRCSVEIRAIVLATRQANPDSPPTTGDNPDMSIVIETLDDGRVRVLGEIIDK